MQTIIYGVPSAPPVIPEPVALPGITVYWTGANGVTWDLTDWMGGLFITQSGLEGLGSPTHTAWNDARSPSSHGQRYTGHIVDARPVVLPLYLYAEPGDAWHAADTALWETLRPGVYGTLTVESPAGVRTLRCRYVSGGDEALTRDPVRFGWQRYAIELVADEDPFWRGEDVTHSWEQATPSDFFGGTAKAPKFFISSGNMLSTATMTNPGEMDAWPVWRVTGPGSAIALGVGGRQVTYPGAVAAGKVLTVDSDPQAQTAVLDGVDVTPGLGGYDFASIPSGQDVPLKISAIGNTRIEATITPRYYRAW